MKSLQALINPEDDILFPQKITREYTCCVIPLKGVVFFIGALLIFFLVIPPAQASVNYALLKNEYTQDHPGQSVIPYPWEPTTSTQVLPINYEIPASPGNSFSITACRDEFEPASFILTAQKDLSGITITVPDLYDGKGNILPSSALDVRLVKVWYQSSSSQTDIHSTGGYYLTPELLLKDDSLVKVDYTTRTNYLKVTLDGDEQYIDISSPTAVFPAAAQVRDETALQPFSLKAQENKQVWLTVHVPNTTYAGDYSGDITISAPSEAPVVMNFSVRVLPFDLAPAPLTYGIYYYGRLAGAPSYSYNKDSTQYTQELQDLRDHGVVYPTLFQQEDSYLNTALSLRNKVGLPRDKIYLAGITSSQDMYIGNPSDPAGLAAVARTVLTWRNHTKAYGYNETYFYGIDEAKPDVLATERPAWQTVHQNGGKMFVAAGAASLQTVADVLDTGIVAYAPNTTIAGHFPPVRTYRSWLLKSAGRYRKPGNLP